MKTIKFVLMLVMAFSISAYAQKKDLKLESSSVKWTGYKIGGSHTGEIKIKSGIFEIKDGVIVKGAVVIDMNSITNTDLKDEGYNQKLVGHLKSDDFFGVEKFPTATFVVTKASKFKAGKATFSGKITIKGKTQDISFEVAQNGNLYSTQLKIDRSKFDVRYGSGSFFDNLGDKAIDDIFILDIILSI